MTTDRRASLRPLATEEQVYENAKHMDGVDTIQYVALMESHRRKQGDSGA